MERRLGIEQAVKATAHKLERLVYRALKYVGQDAGQNYYEQRYKERVIKSLHRRATGLGYQLVGVPKPAHVVP